MPRDVTNSHVRPAVFPSAILVAARSAQCGSARCGSARLVGPIGVSALSIGVTGLLVGLIQIVVDVANPLRL